MRRLIELDMLRGYALVAIMLDHMPLSVLRSGTLARWSAFDAAELFVLLSGFLVGLVWLRVETRETRMAARWRFARRSFQVWRALIIGSVLLALLSAALLRLGLQHTAIWNAYGDWLLEYPFQYISAVALMWLQPNLIDVLAVYVVLLTSVPLLVPLLIRWPVVFAAGSFTLWWFAPVLGPLVPNHEARGILFNPFGWQMLFYSGVAMGIFRERLMPSLLRFREPITIVAAVVFCLGMILPVSALIGHPITPSATWLTRVYGAADKWSLGGTRYLTVIAATWLVAVPLSQPIRWFSASLPGRVLQEIGRCGLWSFTACVLLSVLGDALQMNPPGQGLAWRAAVDAMMILTLWLVSLGWRRWKEMDMSLLSRLPGAMPRSPQR